MKHICSCGKEIVANGWNNNANSILRCEDCNQERQALLEQINTAIAGKEVDTVYIAMRVRTLVSASDFDVDIAYCRDEKMHDLDFRVEE